MHPIKRVSLHQEVLEQTRSLVVEGTWGPGEIIPELEISAALNVSRTPVREALKVLASEGLIDVIPRQGATVKLVDEKEARDIMFVTGQLEGIAARIVCERAPDTAIGRIEKIHNQLLSAHQKKRRQPYFEANQAVHRAIVEAAENGVLTALHAQLMSRLRRIRYACTNDVSSWDGAVKEHKKIMEALMKRDADVLARLLAEHMEAGWTRVASLVIAESAKQKSL